MAKYRKKPIIIEAIQYSDTMRAEDRLPDCVHIVPTKEEGEYESWTNL